MCSIAECRHGNPIGFITRLPVRVMIMISSIHIAVMFVVSQSLPLCGRSRTVFFLACILILDLAHFGGRVTIFSRQHDGLRVRDAILTIVNLTDKRVLEIDRLWISG
jgi:hypothetical protein